MHGNKTVVCVIPARLASTRFPRKALALLHDKPLLQWAYENACGCRCFDRVVVAVDSKELYDAVEAFGGEPMLTDPKCLNGTERLVELQQKGKLQGNIWVNWQGDVPFIPEACIKALLQSCNGEKEGIWTLKKKINNSDELLSPNTVKVVCDIQGKALYFSRSLIPSNASTDIYKHIGLYAYSDEALKKISKLSPCPVEMAEKLEQLRYLYHGMAIQVHETDQEILGIDTKEELESVQRLSFESHSDILFSS